MEVFLLRKVIFALSVWECIKAVTTTFKHCKQGYEARSMGVHEWRATALEICAVA